MKKPTNTKKSVTVLPPVAPPATHNSEKIAALTLLLQSQGWELLKGVLQENLDYLGRMIIKGTDPESGLPLNNLETREARSKYDITEALMKTPEGYIAALKRADNSQPVDFDPYFMNNADILSAQ